MLALTAASPVFRGYLVDSDCRWNIISAASDCRTAGERGEGPLEENERFIPRSRCDSINSFISANGEESEFSLLFTGEIYSYIHKLSTIL